MAAQNNLNGSARAILHRLNQFFSNGAFFTVFYIPFAICPM